MCIHPDKACKYRDEKGYCHWNPDKDIGRCPDDCPWLEKTYIGGVEVITNCIAVCVYDTWEKCSFRGEEKC